MSDQSGMSGRTMSGDSRNVTGSRAEASGRSRSGRRDGRTIGQSGPEAAPASHSVQPESGKESQTLVTSGPSGYDSSGNADPRSFLESKSALPQGAKLIRSKKCKCCTIEKPYDEFYTNSKGNRPATCKSCTQARERHRKRQLRPDDLSEKHSRWRERRRGYALVNLARFRAKKRGLPCTLDAENIQARIDRGACEVTGIPFDLTVPRAWNAPSLDRISTDEGYTTENTRVVIFALNVMANVWGIQRVVDVANAISEQRTRPSAALQESLDNALKIRLNGRGSTLFRQIWKERVTPSGRQYSEHTVSEPRTGDSGFTSVPTPDTMSGPHGIRGRSSNHNHQSSRDLQGVSMLSTVATPKATDGQGGRTTKTAVGGNSYLDVQARLTSVPTAQASDMTGGGQAKRAEGRANLNDHVMLASVASPTAQDCSRGGKEARPWDTGVPLTQQVALATVPTPAARDFKSDSATEEFHERQWDHPRGKPLSATGTLALCENGVDPDGSIRSRLDMLPRQAQLAGGGGIATGGGGGMGSGGQLNPRYSAWLMGVPPAWDLFAVRAQRVVKAGKAGTRTGARQRTRNTLAPAQMEDHSQSERKPGRAG
jgi:hypothetical protein